MHPIIIGKTEVTYVFNNAIFCNVKGRAKRKMEELRRLLDTAKMNYQQLGGELEEDKIKQEEQKESAR